MPVAVHRLMFQLMTGAWAHGSCRITAKGAWLSIFKPLLRWTGF